jgi:hypothetical protein
MMDVDISNILYIIITLVVVIVSVLGKKKKPGTGGSDGSGNASRPGFMENLERILQMGQEEPLISNPEPYEADLSVEEPEVEEVVQKPAAKMRKPGILDEYNRIMNRTTDGQTDLVKSEGQRATEQLEIINLDDETGTDFFELVKNFDARTAIVYSTIINPLDY